MLPERTFNLVLLLASPYVPRWQAACLEQLCQLPFVKIPLVLAHSTAVAGCPENRVRTAGLRMALYSVLDRLVFQRIVGIKDPTKPVHASQTLIGCKWIAVEPCRGRLNSARLAMLTRCSPDLILQLGCANLHEEIAAVAPLGLWYFRHDGEIGSAGETAIFRALRRGRRTVESTLEAHTRDGNHVLIRSWTSVHQQSLQLTKSRIYWKAAHFPGRQLRKLQANGVRFLGLPKASELGELNLACGDRATKPRLPIRFFARLGSQLASKGTRRLLGHHAWQLGLRARKGWSLRDFSSPDCKGFLAVRPPQNGFVADPFLLEHAGRHYIFCEEIHYGNRKGAISWMEVLSDQTVTEPRIALQRPYHLSYPFILRSEGALFMVPETARNRTIELYRCVRFPDRWQLESVLLRGVAAVDTTILEANGRYWLFTCLKEEMADTSDDLHLYWADSIRGPWQAHPQNPIISDVRSARPAGGFFRADQALIRPSQDCSERYGGRINFNRVIVLSESDYREERIGSVGGNWEKRAQGAHTWNCNERFEIIDGPVWQPRMPFGSCGFMFGQRYRRHG